jgi:hypothetical protein
MNHSTIELTAEACCWRDSTGELVPYDREHLVNRPDCFGRYCKKGPYTCKAPVTDAILDRHFRPRSPADVIGLHTTSVEVIEGPDGAEVVSNTSGWAALDIDHHGDGDPPPQNVAANHQPRPEAVVSGRPPEGPTRSGSPRWGRGFYPHRGHLDRSAPATPG